jgi:hypothetical protein
MIFISALKAVRLKTSLADSHVLSVVAFYVQFLSVLLCYGMSLRLATHVSQSYAQIKI